mmetsp:Transcript_104789/g.291836  ORF Transcript_104789/g.291836 Transcript_104789/m.291836 type:complete len:477 (-) Transcript_104789:150-1580(-)|eukprot:CAMPEP_0179021300 /NCGR_PEP_ID=MMETSP0796-20121207/5815_1 /TAXON_ID=73915 /ORGANISM="Pyrodinium bahamense, Strain pbaha01" /LENGTH=476 /DNA_ID=CAMNT_0020717119 /DNA_START=109 /DNA_END=1539 /DNA_ORIENTATION=+
MLPASLSARWMPRDFVEASLTGGVLTLVAYVLMLTLFTLELRSFLGGGFSSELVLDPVGRPQLQINFDIDMLAIECRNLDVVVIDELGQSPIRSLQKHYELSNLDNSGRLMSHHATKAGADEDEDEEAAHRRTAERLLKQDGRQELDADWADSHDGFKHQSFEHVIQFHDFTMINFFAEWCIHCRKFAPMWKEIVEKVKETIFQDRDSKTREVAAIKMNCVDFQPLCQSAGIAGYPTIRLYKSDGTFTHFSGKRSIDHVLAFVKDAVSTSAYVMKKHHQELEKGCNMKGYLQVPRVPGHLELMAGGGDQNLDPTMTNVSHAIKRLSFSDPTGGHWIHMVLPIHLHFWLRHTNTLDQRSFVTSVFHETYEHHLRVVSAVTDAGVGYLYTHYGRTARLNTSVIPQARFFYDIEPFSIMVKSEAKQWYDFGTSLLAVLGGIFVLLRLVSMVLLTAATTLERTAGRSKGGARGGANALMT